MRSAAGIVSVLALVSAASVAHAEVPAGDTFEVEAKGAGYGALAGGGAGLVLGVAMKMDEPILGALIGAGAGMVIGVPIGLHRYADARGGTGKGWGTALGSVAGIATGVISIVGSKNMKATGQNIAVGIALVAACVTLGPIMGYRLTRDDPADAMMMSPLSVAF